jgi:hypothetical protein
LEDEERFYFYVWLPAPPPKSGTLPVPNLESRVDIWDAPQAPRFAPKKKIGHDADFFVKPEYNLL